MTCFRCHRPWPLFSLYRVNAKGQPGIFACVDHRLEADKDLDAIVDELAAKATGGAAPGNEEKSHE